jgi:hypothetical protein
MMQKEIAVTDSKRWHSVDGVIDSHFLILKKIVDQ